MPAPSKALERLEKNRRRAELRLAEVQRALDQELGWAPRAKAWVLPLVGFAIGLTLAGGMTKKLTGRRRAGRERRRTAREE